MRSWFLSYNTQDHALMEALEAALRQKDAGAHIFFAPKSLRAGSYFLPEIYAKACRSWYRDEAKSVVNSKIRALKKKGDDEGVRAWTQVRRSLERQEQSLN
jgi:hypothetical protein